MKPAAYVYQCIGCGLLDVAFRRDVLTCSGACRIKAHRNGSAKTLRELAAKAKLAPAMLLQAQAAQVLSPDSFNKVKAGAMELDDAQPELCKLFDELVVREMAAKQSGAAS